jgi:hypothetical protein
VQLTALYYNDSLKDPACREVFVFFLLCQFLSKKDCYLRIVLVGHQAGNFFPVHSFYKHVTRALVGDTGFEPVTSTV